MDLVNNFIHGNYIDSERLDIAKEFPQLKPYYHFCYNQVFILLDAMVIDHNRSTLFSLLAPRIREIHGLIQDIFHHITDDHNRIKVAWIIKKQQDSFTLACSPLAEILRQFDGDFCRTIFVRIFCRTSNVTCLDISDILLAIDSDTFRKDVVRILPRPIDPENSYLIMSKFRNEDSRLFAANILKVSPSLIKKRKQDFQNGNAIDLSDCGSGVIYDSATKILGKVDPPGKPKQNEKKTLPLEETKNENKQEKECSICNEGKPDHAYIPCGHFNCIVCAKKMFESAKKECTICRNKIEGILRTYGD